MHRRQLLKFATYSGVVLAVGAGSGAWWLSGPKPPTARFADLASARRWLDELAAHASARSTTPWSLAHVLEHCAQSIEFSLHGFPVAKPRWFQATAGALAISTFERRGAMRHGLTEPIPGAPALAASDTTSALQRLRTAFDRFERHAGALHPHFAYGELDKAQYTRAHLMHLADHATEVVIS